MENLVYPGCLKFFFSPEHKSQICKDKITNNYISHRNKYIFINKNNGKYSFDILTFGRCGIILDSVYICSTHMS